MSKQLNYIGFKNEAFTVIDRIKKKYIVKCNKCGKEFVRDIASVKKFKGSGCLDCTPRYSNTSPVVHHLYIHYKSHASSRNLKFNLTEDQFSLIAHQNCYYCGAKPTIYKQLYKYAKNTINESLNGIDRIDSSKGYELSNIVPCCTMCNRMKLDFTSKEFLNHIQQIHNYQNSSTTIPSGSTSKASVDGNEKNPNKDCDIV